MASNLPARVRRQQDLAVYERSQEFGIIDHKAEVGEAKVSGTNRVAQRAIYETMLTGMVRREAERIAPDQAEIYAMISAAAGLGSVRIITTMYERY